MKKIIIVTKKMVTGGIEKSLIKMLENMPEDEYDITLIVTEKGGELENLIPKFIKVIYLIKENYSVKKDILSNIKKAKLVNALKMYKNLAISSTTKNLCKSYTYLSKLLPIQKTEYDLAIAYHTPISLPIVYVINNINAKKKIAWIHSDIERYKEYIDSYEKYYEKYDHIFSVSEEGKDRFINKFPQYINKISVFYNSIYDKEIQKQSNEFEGFEDKYSGFKIVTVGRISDEKGYDFVVEVVDKLKKDGYDFKWYWIGDGLERNIMENEIVQRGIEDKLILLGSKINPYPYMKHCDLYVQPSKTEGYCTTITEARCLNKAIITTDVNGMREQIKDGKTGVIVPINADAIYKGVKKILDNYDFKEELENNVSLESIDTRYEFIKLNNFL